MKDPRLGIGIAFLGLLGAVALLAPWLGLRDPVAQPGDVLLRELPPLSRVHALLLRDGSRAYADEIDPGDEVVRYRRGTEWREISRAELAGSEPSDWHRQPLYPLGTDRWGRDLLSRLVNGARVSLGIGLLAGLLAVGIGGTIGVSAGLAGGWVDELLMRATDMVFAVPRLFLALLLVSLYGRSITTTVVVLGVTTWMAAARLARGEVLSLRERTFVEAARAAGAPPLRIGVRHLLPGAATPLIVETTLRVGDTILLEAALSFLGLGVPQPTPSWGNMIADGQGSLPSGWWVSTFPGLAVATTVIALNLVGDAARERLDRRLAR